MVTLLERLSRRATVSAVSPVTPWITGVRIAGPRLRDLKWTPGQHLNVMPTAPHNFAQALRDGWRKYTVWDHDPAGELELRVVTRGHDGPGARWAAGAAVGADVAVSSTEGRLTARPGAAYHLVLGEETGSVAMGAIARAVPADEPVLGVIEVDTPEDRPDMPRAQGLTWAYRHGAAPASTPVLLEALRELRLPDEPGMAYVAGEARTCQQVRAHLIRERGWPRANVLVHAFWTVSRRRVSSPAPVPGGRPYR
ncbi:siderophore-interacting protein [Actinoplanes derwentensis]|uniref:NADPH-dependent ferric siderophore reductase, contains FAD-binding and SIP domains n=1 Tax=Actinoplanes derwentensis TaxID=113562 RepID=A0A1H2AFB6_9ACTN|nr:siderophore-interacting protein [Actinoplanes derwentensis]GID88249.1 hypothetical protein Ade03nite_71730 [Actinoplanes derwentensis]SDT44663.1 NADPH-dependent ferric siderophore reductase, contains FAD-binding and SIP domains [Actinoplanes derwentensis]